MNMQKKCISATVIGLCFLMCMASQAQTPTRNVIDFQCIVQKGTLPCGFKIPVPDPFGNGGGIQIEASHALGSSTSGGTPDVGLCLSKLLASPPSDCVIAVRVASDIDAQLARQEEFLKGYAIATRKREVAMCQKFAPKPSECDEGVPPVDTK
ncbi:hypothetical protein UNDKW_5975 (plasmid) [Undibacterium sp. KW1]|uniref:hypothetical protein n=1 Tax=Undibacterium sp. KW1 TaxID=2058624 RepID=UPI001331CC13|nr:hypothetical protein [Undibacterium sp. KW1]BBB64248.1 hypothetical protein UNDKW_5975 [Undibacterium sp. KW1]